MHSLLQIGPFVLDSVPDIEWDEEGGYFRITGRYGVVVHVQPKVFLGLSRRVRDLASEWGARPAGVVALEQPGKRKKKRKH